MAEGRPTLARLAGEYGLKTLDADIAAKKVGVKLRRGAAKVAPWQESLLRPELERMKAMKEYRQWVATRDAGPMDYEAADNYSYADNEVGRLGFSNTQMADQLGPVLKRMQDEAEDSA